MDTELPLALDLFCGGGGAAEGLMRAGFRVTGIDINPRHRANYPGHFIEGDALHPPVRLGEFDFVWASPPCQAYSAARNFHAQNQNPRLVEPVRSLLKKARNRGVSGTVIENVSAAPIRPDVRLTGPMVGLDRIQRLRHFEIDGFTVPHQPLKHVPKADWRAGRAATITQSLTSPSHFYPRKQAGLPGRISVKEAMEVMGITVPMTCSQVGEAVPPAYAEYIVRWWFKAYRWWAAVCN